MVLFEQRVLECTRNLLAGSCDEGVRHPRVLEVVADHVSYSKHAALDASQVPCEQRGEARLLEDFKHDVTQIVG